MTTDSGHVLIADDDPGVRESLAAYLEDSGYRTTEAENGQQAIAICRELDPDLVLCDLRMPTMDGLGVLARAAKEFPDIPIIIVSGQGELGDAIAALKLGAWDYITKPIADMAVLEHAVERALERARLLKENREYHEYLEDANARLRQALDQMHADEEAGRQIQFQLLPDNGFRCGSIQFFRHLITSTSLSGDFVDYFRIDEEHLGFYLADVSGHGVPSALITVILKNTMTRYLEDFWQRRDDLILTPEYTLARLNELFLSTRLDKHMVIFYGVIDLAANKLRYSTAGHYPFAILYDGETAHFEEHKSLPVGLFGHAVYDLVERELPERFVLLLLSDGILEVLPQAHLKDKEASLLTLVDSLDMTIEQLCEKTGILEIESEIPDDITLLLIRAS